MVLVLKANWHILYYIRGIPITEKTWGRGPNPDYPHFNFGTGDTLHIIVNTSDGTLSCKVNEGDLIILFNELERDSKYKWKINFALENKDDSVSICNFYQHQ